jgi:Na+-driven multidrug efflux pump
LLLALRAHHLQVQKLIYLIIWIFLTNLSDANTAFTFVKMCTIPMVILNSLTVGVSVLLVTILSKERILRSKSQEQIAQTFQRWLILSVIIAFISMSIFTYNLQTSMRQHQIQDTFKTTIEDVIKDITEKSNPTLLKTTDLIQSEYIFLHQLQEYLEFEFLFEFCHFLE